MTKKSPFINLVSSDSHVNIPQGNLAKVLRQKHKILNFPPSETMKKVVAQTSQTFISLRKSPFENILHLFTNVKYLKLVCILIHTNKCAFDPLRNKSHF